MCTIFYILVKVLIFVVNFIVTLVGLALIAIGSILVVYKNSLPDSVDLFAIVTIVIGCIIFLVAFCGCCGAIADSQCLLISYIIFSILFTGLSIYLAVISSNYKEAAEKDVTEILDKIFENADDRKTLYFLEYLFSCCGTTGADSYEALDLPIPPTCCGDSSIDISNIEDLINNFNETGIDYCSKDDAFDGCSQLLTNLVEEVFGATSIIAISLTCTGVIVVILSIYLVVRVRRNNGKVIEPPYHMQPQYPMQPQNPTAPQYPMPQGYPMPHHYDYKR